MRGEVFLRASFLKDVLVDFLFCESSVRMFFMKVLCGGFDSGSG